MPELKEVELELRFWWTRRQLPPTWMLCFPLLQVKFSTMLLTGTLTTVSRVSAVAKSRKRKST